MCLYLGCEFFFSDFNLRISSLTTRKMDPEVGWNGFKSFVTYKYIALLKIFIIWGFLFTISMPPIYMFSVPWILLY